MAARPRALVAPPSWTARWRARVFLHDPSDANDVTLAHSRIYILPTRRGLALLATLALMLVTSMNYNLALGYVATFVATGVFSAALLHAFRNLAGLSIRPGSAGEAFAGGRIAFSLALSGGVRARIAIAVTPRTGATTVSDVEPDTIVPIRFDADAAMRGRVPLGRVTIASDQPLGLWRAWSYVHFPLAGIAYPVPESGAPPLPASSSGNDANASGRADDAELAGLRAYQRGDPLQRVAWKAVARGAGWYTKQFEGAGGGGPVLLDLASLPPSLSLEHKLSRLTAWVLGCERAGRAYALALPGASLAAGQGREHRRAVLTALALHRAPP
jgi:uncharacterized protein (DUF58 family)